ncbi:glycoside hydrolase family 65 [Thermoclostridium stercorarium]|uniref:glycoside hydrolase family 65 n=1 Tax=Thermoclostridium stercorarium TaxID=1510 RepID=UPI0004B340A9|nr:glycoside hydrolase family 65 [Thermoclostridium stercorarium]UZQ86107.1 glycoside hydrolase family 65 [Thermoclostridium stercorarium]
MAVDRYNVVTRHNPVITRIDPFSPLSVGNGEFAFTADITGLQTFPEFYENGIPLCTQSQWGWHTEPADNESGAYSLNDLRKEIYEANGRSVGYNTSGKGQEKVYNWLRQNPHRLHLGQIGLDIKKEDLSPVTVGDIENPRHMLDLWSGIMQSTFTVQGFEVETEACCHPKKDILAFRIRSGLLGRKRLGIKVRFPYGSAAKTAADWKNDEKHYTEIMDSGQSFIYLRRRLDRDQYFVKIVCSEGAIIERTGRNSFVIRNVSERDELEFSCCFSPAEITEELPLCRDIFNESRKHWQDFWNGGGMIDFGGSTDKRAGELERRVILSMYLTAIQCAGSLPPQETGLTFNSWYGKFHLEMHWWHGVHFVLWGRPELFEKSLWWYGSILDRAKELAESQGYKGARWPKMTSPEGYDSPSPIGPLLIWQQPHPIYYAELLYSVKPYRETLEKYKDIVFETAEFMASYAAYDGKNKRYVLGPALIPAQENHDPRVTLNPTFELEYWVFGLKTANEWRKRLGLDINTKWEDIVNNLAELPVKDNLYLAHENCPDTFTLFNRDHPSMLGALGILPGTKADPKIMLNTLLKVMDSWQMENVWGWDFPMMAMTAARLGRPDLALDALLYDSPKNVYLPNGHNKQATREDLPIYLPGNGGLLTAVAMMTAGWRGCKEILPGFPKDGTWKVEWEGINPML